MNQKTERKVTQMVGRSILAKITLSSLLLFALPVLFSAASAQDRGDGVLNFPGGRISNGEAIIGVGFRNSDSLRLVDSDGTPFTVQDGYCFLTAILQPDEWGSIWLATSQDTGQWVFSVNGGHDGSSSKRTVGVARCVKF